MMYILRIPNVNRITSRISLMFNKPVKMTNSVQQKLPVASIDFS